MTNIYFPQSNAISIPGLQRCKYNIEQDFLGSYTWLRLIARRKGSYLVIESCDSVLLSLFWIAILCPGWKGKISWNKLTRDLWWVKQGIYFCTSRSEEPGQQNTTAPSLGPCCGTPNINSWSVAIRHMWGLPYNIIQISLCAPNLSGWQVSVKDTKHVKNGLS